MLPSFVSSFTFFDFVDVLCGVVAVVLSRGARAQFIWCKINCPSADGVKLVIPKAIQMV